MFRSAYQLLVFLEDAEKIHGRKRFQKMIHLLTSSGMPFGFKFRYHHYGPYSSQLQAEVDQLVRQGYVKEELINGAYDYFITEKGLEFKHALERNAAYEFTIDESLLNDLVIKDTGYLEMFSTYVFLRETGDTTEEAKERAVQLKPHLETWIDEAVADYEALILN